MYPAALSEDLIRTYGRHNVHLLTGVWYGQYRVLYSCGFDRVRLAAPGEEHTMIHGTINAKQQYH